MNGARERVRQNQARFAEIATLEQTLDHVQYELQLYREALCSKLACLRQTSDTTASTAPAEPEAPAVLPMLLAATREVLLDKPSGSDRRAWRRRVGNPVSIIIADASRTTEPMSGWVTDRSQNGLGLWADEEEGVGTVLSVRPIKGDEWTRVVVKHCRHDERGNWVLGCQFVEYVPWKQLRMFG